MPIRDEIGNHKASEGGLAACMLRLFPGPVEIRGHHQPGFCDGKIEATGAKAPFRDCLHTAISKTIGGGLGLAGRSDSFFFYATVVPNPGHACRWRP